MKISNYIWNELMIFEASDTTNRKLVSGNSSWPSSPCDGANPARAIASLFISGQENPGVKKQLEEKVKINVV